MYLALITLTTPAPVPTDIISSSNTYCDRWYDVQVSNYCNFLVLKNSVPSWRISPF